MPRMDAIVKELNAPRTYAAQRTAKCGHKDNFEERRGCFEDDGSGTIRFFENNPTLRRADLIRGFVAWLAAHGHQLDSADSFPRTGEHAGYTLGLVIRFRPDMTFAGAHEEVCSGWNDIVRTTAVD